MSSQRTFYKWELVILLWLAFFFNQADRQIFNVVLPLIKAELKFSDAELGLIASILIWTYGLLVPVAGFAGDMFNKKGIIVFSLMFWSVATLFTGPGSTLLYFILIRGVATGGGEAFYAPTANAMISEQHTASRSFALSLHQSAVYFGIVLSGFLAGYIAEIHGWRVAFYSFGGFGILLAGTMMWRLRSPANPENRAEGVRQLTLRQAVDNAKVIFGNSAFWLLTAAFSCMVFVNTGYLTWMPMFLYEKFDLSLSSAGFSSMFYHHAGAFAGVLAGGRLSDALLKKNRRIRPTLQMVGLFFGAPFIFLMATAETQFVTFLALGLFGFFRGVFDSNIFASLFDVVEAKQRSTSAGLMLMIAFLTSAFSPLLLGVLKPVLGLSGGLSWLSIFYLLGALILFFAIRFSFVQKVDPDLQR